MLTNPCQVMTDAITITKTSPRSTETEGAFQTFTWYAITMHGLSFDTPHHHPSDSILDEYNNPNNPYIYI